MIDRFKEIGLNMVSDRTARSDQLNGATFLVTGTLESFSRKEIKERIEELGGRVISSVSKNLNYLLVGTNPGSKLTRAQKIETIEIISESDFLDMIK